MSDDATSETPLISPGFLLKLLFFALVFVYYVFFSPSYGKKLEFNGAELYYTKSVTREQADKLGKFLVKNNIFSGKPMTVQLDKNGGTLELRFVIKKEYKTDRSLDEIFSATGFYVSQEVFKGAPLSVHLCDDKLKTVRALPCDERLAKKLKK